MTAKHLTFTAKGSGLRVDLDRLIRSRMLLQANSGGGKSHALRQLLEETHGRVPHLIIDPEGEFASLRERYDYVLAGKNGDVQATPRTAALLCRRLMELGASAVIDIFDLSKPDRREFVHRFITELMSLPRNLWRPTLVVVDEAHDFAPEKGHGESVSTEAVITLCSQGRKRGYCAVLATQRISKLHKDAAAELNNKLIGRTGLDVDMKRAGEELGFDKEGRLQLKKLDPGDFFVFGPAVSLEVERVRTGEVRTSHPEPGQVSLAPPPPPAKVAKMLQQLADLPKEAEERERTVEALDQEVRKLRAELARAKIAQPPPPPPKEVPVITEADHQRIAEAFTRAREDLEKGRAAIVALADQVAAPLTMVAEALRAIAPSRPVAAHRTAAAAPPARPRELPRAAPAASGDGVSLPQGERKMLEALALRDPDALTRDQLAILSGFAVSGGTFRTYLPALKRKGLVEERGELVQLTQAGRDAAAGAIAVAPQTAEDVRSMWRNVLGAGERKMFDVLVRYYPEAISRGALGAESGFAVGGGTFRTYLPKLKRLGLATESGDQVRASEALFR